MSARPQTGVQIFLKIILMFRPDFHDLRIKTGPFVLDPGAQVLKFGPQQMIG
jgi:hypothetical protein